MTGQVPANVTQDIADYIENCRDRWLIDHQDEREFNQLTKEAIAQFLVDNYLKIVER